MVFRPTLIFSQSCVIVTVASHRYTTAPSALRVSPLQSQTPEMFGTCEHQHSMRQPTFPKSQCTPPKTTAAEIGATRAACIYAGKPNVVARFPRATPTAVNIEAMAAAPE